MARSEFTLRTKLEAMTIISRCPGCNEKFGSLANVDFDHRIPDAMGGKNDLENCDPRCKKCHSIKTNGKKHTSAGSDKNIIAKHKRLTGQTKTGPKAKIESRGFQTNKDSKLKQKFGGKVEAR